MYCPSTPAAPAESTGATSDMATGVVAWSEQAASATSEANAMELRFMERFLLNDERANGRPGAGRGTSAVCGNGYRIRHLPRQNTVRMQVVANSHCMFIRPEMHCTGTTRRRNICVHPS